MEITTRIYSIGVTQQVTETFSKREFIVETQEEYKQYLSLQVTKDKCGILDSYKKGDEVKVHLNLRGRLWTNKEGVEVAFNTLECWRIEKITEATQPAKPVFETTDVINNDKDDLPF